MPQHVPYTLPGYYYFRPYNYTRIAPQQEAARRWGGDWRNPYDNRFLQKIADELADEASTPEEIPKLPNTSLGQPRHSDALDTPTRPHEPMVRLAPPIVSP